MTLICHDGAHLAVKYFCKNFCHISGRALNTFLISRLPKE